MPRTFYGQQLVKTCRLMEFFSCSQDIVKIMDSSAEILGSARILAWFHQNLQPALQLSCIDCLFSFNHVIFILSTSSSRADSVQNHILGPYQLLLSPPPHEQKINITVISLGFIPISGNNILFFTPVISFILIIINLLSCIFYTFNASFICHCL